MEFYQMSMFNKVLMNHLRLEKYQDLMLISQKILKLETQYT